MAIRMESPFAILPRSCLILVFIASFIILLGGVEAKNKMEASCHSIQTLFQYQPEFKGSIPGKPRKGKVSYIHQTQFSDGILIPATSIVSKKMVYRLMIKMPFYRQLQTTRIMTKCRML